jgi:hypothetical protein
LSYVHNRPTISIDPLGLNEVEYYHDGNRNSYYQKKFDEAMDEYDILSQVAGALILENIEANAKADALKALSAKMGEDDRAGRLVKLRYEAAREEAWRIFLLRRDLNKWRQQYLEYISWLYDQLKPVEEPTPKPEYRPPGSRMGPHYLLASGGAGAGGGGCGGNGGGGSAGGDGGGGSPGGAIGGTLDRSEDPPPIGSTPITPIGSGISSYETCRTTGGFVVAEENPCLFKMPAALGTRMPGGLK